MNLFESQEKMRHAWDKRKFPTLVYVETTNYCNSDCTYCIYGRMQNEKRVMTLSEFKFVADKVKEHGLMIGALFCFGEPLLDPGIFEKMKYAREIGVLPGYIGLNTNTSILTREKYDLILKYSNNITLSFPNTGEMFNKMCRGLDYDTCYRNAIEFIKYRDKVRPDFIIQIGCNDVTGHNRKNVEEAFRGYHIGWARDAEIKWGGKVITGVIDRSIMYNDWQCDGLKGAMQVKPNGDCCFCAYDVINGETKYGNIFTDSWEQLEENFKKKWKAGELLCLRCDFWHNYYQMIDGGWKRGSHIDDSWQAKYD